MPELKRGYIFVASIRRNIKNKDMNFIKRLVRDYKINKGLMPLKTITLSSGVVLEHFVIRGEKVDKRVIRIELKKLKQ